MGYYINFEKILLDEFCVKLKKADLLPSRNVLKNNIDFYFGLFKKYEINNLLELLQFLKKTSNIEQLVTFEHVNADYLKILLREINSLQPKACKITEFTMLNADTHKKLLAVGINTTLQFFEYACTDELRTMISKKTGINIDEINLLASLTDLNRVRWVGATFAQMLYKCGYTSANLLAKADYKLLHIKINDLNKTHNVFKGSIGLHDMKLCVEAAAEVSCEIEL